MQCELFEPDAKRDVRTDIGRVAPPRPQITRARKRRTSSERAEDLVLIARLQEAHEAYNADLFGGELTIIKLRISRRMKNRLGHYMVACPKQRAEIAISLRHVERDLWSDVLHTLVHEMVHQWQDENGLALDHGSTFRAKAHEVGISARATRPPTPAAAANRPRLAARAVQDGRA